MLFALGFDKLIFGHSPDLVSIAGSTLILGSAMYVAFQGSPVAKKTRQTGGGDELADEESQQGLMSSVQDLQTGEDHERLPVEQVQMRVLR